MTVDDLIIKLEDLRQLVSDIRAVTYGYQNGKIGNLDITDIQSLAPLITQADIDDKNKERIRNLFAKMLLKIAECKTEANNLGFEIP